MTVGTGGASEGGASAGPPTHGEHDADHEERPARSPRRRLWQWIRVVVSLCLLGVVGYLLTLRASEVIAAWHLLGHLNWSWVGLAVLFEAASMVVFAGMQRWLLRAGGVSVPRRAMVEITLAGNAMAATLPGGVAWAGAWVFGQLRLRGVSRFLRVWVFLAAGTVSSFALFIVVAAGIELAGSHGPVSGLRWAALVLAAIPVATLGLMAVRDQRPVRRAGKVLSAALSRRRWGSRLIDWASGLLARMRSVRMSRIRWAEVLGLGLLNWLYDCAVLILCLVALRVSVPWRGIFVVYGLTQIAAVFPLTPGGLGVVEGALGALLHAYGVPVDQAVAVVIVYRIVSFWGLVPIGWGVWVALDLLANRGRRTGRAHPWAEHRHGEPSSTDARRRPGVLPAPRPCPADTDCAGDAPKDPEHVEGEAH